MENNCLPEIMDVAQVAQYLGVSQSHIYKAAQKGEIPGSKVGSLWRFKKQTIDKWLAQNVRRLGGQGD